MPNRGDRQAVPRDARDGDEANRRRALALDVAAAHGLDLDFPFDVEG